MQSSPAEPSKVLTSIFMEIFFKKILWLDTVITVALLLCVEVEISKFFS